MGRTGDARWTKKNDETHYGYKSHINAAEEALFLRLVES